MEYPLATLLGTIGVAALLAAYFLNLFGKINSGGLAYILTNLLGASLACASSVLIQFIPFVILEGTWALVSLSALIKRQSAAK